LAIDDKRRPRLLDALRLPARESDRQRPPQRADQRRRVRFAPEGGASYLGST
jgi:hypothetical protein